MPEFIHAHVLTPPLARGWIPSLAHFLIILSVWTVVIKLTRPTP